MIVEKIILKICRSNIGMAKKEKIVELYEYNLKDTVRELSLDEKLMYLESDMIPNNFKKMIIDYISKYFDRDKKREFWNNFYEKYYKEDDLFTDKYPMEFRWYVVEREFGVNVSEKIKGINEMDISIQKKKLIIDTVNDDDDIICMYKEIKDPELVKYIIKKRSNSSKIITAIIDNKNTTEDNRNYIIQNNVNVDNYIDIITYCYDDESIADKIYEMTNDICNDAILGVSESDKLLSIFIDTQNGKFRDKFLEIKLDTINKIMEDINVSDYKKLLQGANNKDSVSYIINNYPEKANKIINELNDSEVFRFLYNTKLPDEYKRKIIREKENVFMKEYEEKSISSLLSSYSVDDSLIGFELRAKILELRKDDILAYYNKRGKNRAIDDIRYNKYCDMLKMFLIDNYILDEDDMLCTIRFSDEKTYDLIFETKWDMIYNMLNKHTNDELFTGRHLHYINADEIIKRSTRIIKERIDKLSFEQCYKYLRWCEVFDFIKVMIIDKLGILRDDMNDYFEMLYNVDNDKLTHNYYRIKSAFQKMGIDFNSFIQYGSGSDKYKNWIDDLVNIIDNNLEEFVMVLKYLNNSYYDETRKDNKIYVINNLLETIRVFNTNKKLLMDLMSNNVVLSKKDKNNLRFLFEIKGQDSINSLEDIEEYRHKVNDEVKNIILTSNNLEVLKRKCLEVLLMNAQGYFRSIYGIEGLKMLRLNNNNSEEMTKLIDELIEYSHIIEYVINIKDIEEVRKILEHYVCDNSDELIVIQDIYSGYKEKVRYLFEMDTRINLTSTDQLNMLARSNDLEHLYGGIVYDVRDKNYVLYGHIMSKSENAEDVIDGVSNSKKNFISMSAISYMGDKYYYDKGEMIFAFTEIPEGSFICSSITNMTSNVHVDSNSSEFLEFIRTQLGILQTSVPRTQNSEILLYREGVKPMGLILPGGRKPTDSEIQCHEKYNIPFIITQDLNTTIENVNMVFNKNDIQFRVEDNTNEMAAIRRLKNYIDIENINVNVKDSQYTGREVAILTDSHALYEPTLAVLENIRKSGIKEIYSLGDNVGSGPNPREVIELLNQYGVISIAGNSEYYNTLGVEPFIYLTDERLDNQEWTYDKLGNDLIREIKMYPASIDIILGNKKVALCHFANDVRWDYRKNSTWTYQKGFDLGVSGRQFLYTNSNDAYNDIHNVINDRDKDDKALKGYISSMEEPLFNGKNICEYDSVIQGHVHFEMEDYLGNTKIHTLRAVAMGYNDDEDKEVATYYILKEKVDGGFEIVRKNVEYDRYSMLANINSSNMPGKSRILNFVK